MKLFARIGLLALYLVSGAMVCATAIAPTAAVAQEDGDDSGGDDDSGGGDDGGDSGD